MESNTRKITEIFTQDRKLEIPFFQRSYVWKEEQWQRFLIDLEYVSGTNRPYFFGSLILKQQGTPTSASVGDVRTVIDGQQRLTTLTIFFKVLSLLTENKNIFRRFMLDESPVALIHNHNDLESFERIAQLTELEDIPQDDAKPDNIINAYNFFKDNVDIEKFDETAIRQRVVFVVVDLTETEDEQQIFDTLNSTGVMLTTAELLKNYFFQRDDFEIYKTHWRAVFEQDDETKQYWDQQIYAGQDWRTFIDLFFYAYLQIKVQNENDRIEARDRESFARLESLFSSYKKLINDYEFDKKDILGEIKTYAGIFRQRFDAEVVNDRLEESPSMPRINAMIFGLGTTTLIPYILLVLKNTSDEERQELFGAIEGYIMRRLVVRRSNRGYNLLFLRMIRENILTKKDFYQFVANLSDTGNDMPTDAELSEGFHNSKLVNNVALGILYFIESYGRGGMHSTALLGMWKYSLEHLMPKKWRNNWGELDEEQASTRDRKLLTLGNLAIIPQRLNASIRDADWETKLQGVGKHGGLKEYAADIDIHQSFLEHGEWDEEKIERRADLLLDKAKKIWPTK